MAGRISGVAVFYATAGGVLLWSGIKGQTIGQTIHAITSGSPQALSAQGSETIGTPVLGQSGGTPAAGAPAAPATITPGSPAAASTGGTPTSNKSLALVLMSAYGWAAQYSDLVNLWNQESGWNQNARNPSSGAYGIAQALGHGTAGSAAANGTNEYGGYGLTDAEAKSANGGSPYYQIIWGLAYIKSTYGSPAAAWAHEQANNWY